MKHPVTRRQMVAGPDWEDLRFAWTTVVLPNEALS